MSDVRLPLRIKIDIRDRFDAPNAPAQKALSTLESVIGLQTICNIDWHSFYASLERNFPDNGAFVSSIVDVIVAWCDVLSTRIEDSRFTAWTEKLIRKIESVSSIKVRLLASRCNRPVTTWSDDYHGFLLLFPSAIRFSPERASTGFEMDFQNLFGPEMRDEPTQDSLSSPNNNEYSDSSETSVGSSKFGRLAIKNENDKLPLIDAVPSPDDLFRNAIPYIMIVSEKASDTLTETGSSRLFNQESGRTIGQSSSTQKVKGGGKLTVQCSHGPSLQFLHEYLQRWVKRDHLDGRKVPLLRITLHESNFGPGLNPDTLTIEPYGVDQRNRGIEVNPTMILALVENILGYRASSISSAGYWEFRRDVAFS